MIDLERIRATIRERAARYPREQREARDRAHGDAYVKALIGALVDDGGVRRRQALEVMQFGRDLAALRASGRHGDDELSVVERELAELRENVEGLPTSLGGGEAGRVILMASPSVADTLGDRDEPESGPAPHNRFAQWQRTRTALQGDQ